MRAVPLSVLAVALPLAIAGTLLAPSVGAQTAALPSARAATDEPVASPPAVAPPLPVTEHEGTSAGAMGEPTIATDVTPAAVSVPLRKLRSVPLKDFPRARGGKPLVWDAEYRRWKTSDFVLTATDAAIALAAAVIKPLPKPWVGPILFDNAARNALRLKSLDARGWAGDTSDVLLSVSTMGPFLIDSLATAWWYRGSVDVAQQMALIDMETLSVTAAIQGLSVELTGRQRPYVQTCGGVLPRNSNDCVTDSRDRSFFSGHTSITFTSAALVCSHHLNLDLFENSPADEVSCATAEAAAATTGLLRIMSDNHWASDVITGALVGNAVGFGMPYFLHYRRRTKESAPQSSERSDFTIHLVPTGLGASAVGTF